MRDPPKVICVLNPLHPFRGKGLKKAKAIKIKYREENLCIINY